MIGRHVIGRDGHLRPRTGITSGCVLGRASTTRPCEERSSSAGQQAAATLKMPKAYFPVQRALQCSRMKPSGPRSTRLPTLFAVGLRPCQACRPRCHCLQQVEAPFRRRAAAWPSTESIAKIISATGATLDEFPTGRRPRHCKAAVSRRVCRCSGFAQAGAGGFFDDAGFPAGQGWDLVELPAQAREGAYALQVQGDSMLPLYRDGDMLIVEPAAPLRRGDRVVVKTASGEVMAKLLARRTAEKVELIRSTPRIRTRTVPRRRSNGLRASSGRASRQCAR